MRLISLICHTPIVIWGFPCACGLFQWFDIQLMAIGASACPMVASSGFYWSPGPPPLGDARGIVPPHRDAIETASFVGVFVDCCLSACCPGRRWGDREQLVAQHPVASGVALGMLHWAICFVLHQCTAMAIKMAGRQGTLFLINNFVINHNCS